MRVTDEMVSRFLAWNLPKDFFPDGGIKFERKVGTAEGERDRADMGPGWWPVGTNLLTAEQAKRMLEHVLGTGKVLPPGFEDEMHRAAHEESNRDWRDWLRGARWAVRRLLEV